MTPHTGYCIHWASSCSLLCPAPVFIWAPDAADPSHSTPAACDLLWAPEASRSQGGLSHLPCVPGVTYNFGVCLEPHGCTVVVGREWQGEAEKASPSPLDEVHIIAQGLGM